MPAETAPTPAPALVSSENIANLSSQQFRHIITESFRRKGFDVEVMPKDVGEAVDMVLRERDNVLLVRCVHSNGHRVDVGTANELCDAMRARSVGKGVLATSGDLTDAAGEFCRAHSIYGLDASRLLAFVDPQAMPLPYEIASDQQVAPRL